MRSKLLVVQLLCFVAATVLITLWSSTARAYPWMIRHEYTACVQCHADPSGGGLLSPYGRAQGEVLLRSRYGSTSEEPGKIAGFAWGDYEPPEWLLLGGSFRYGYLITKPNGSPSNTQLLWMQSDLQGQVTVGKFRANASIGFLHNGGPLNGPVQITQGAQDNLVSREYWVGYSPNEEGTVLVRAGRINLPFGIRNVEHNMHVRADTRTDINVSQQHGVAFSYSGERFRGEFMGIAGNFQISPDTYRERGYSGYGEVDLAPKITLGASSLITYAKRDLYSLQQNFLRQAHGLFTRISPAKPLVLLAEADFLLHSSADQSISLGNARFLQADVEVTQGVHVLGTVEDFKYDSTSTGDQFDAWLGAWWFFAPHADIRVDAVSSWVPVGSTRTHVMNYLGQLHFYL